MNFNMYRDLVKYTYLNKFPWLRDYSCTRDVAFTFKPYSSYPGTMEIYLDFTFREDSSYPWILLYKKNNLQPLDISEYFNSINKDIQNDMLFNLDLLAPSKKVYTYNLFPDTLDIKDRKELNNFFLEEKKKQFADHVERIRNKKIAEKENEQKTWKSKLQMIF